MVLGRGRVCLKIAGREAGRYCVILKKMDENFVLVTGPKLLTGVKKRRCNIEHLEPTEHKVEVKEGAKEEDLIEAYEKAGLITKLNLKKPAAAKLKTLKKGRGKGKKAKRKTKKRKSKKAKKSKAK